MGGERERCAVCGEPIASTDRVRAWPGKYAHSDCASYSRRRRRRGERPSHRVHRKFTRT